MYRFKKQTIRKTGRVAWLKLCNLRNIAFKFFVSIIAFLGMKKSQTDSDIDADLLKTAEKKRTNYIRSHLASSTPTNAISKAKARIDFQFDSDCLELAQQHFTPLHIKTNKIVNSTPVLGSVTKTIFE